MIVQHESRVNKNEFNLLVNTANNLLMVFWGFHPSKKQGIMFSHSATLKLKNTNPWSDLLPLQKEHYASKLHTPATDQTLDDLMSGQFPGKCACSVVHNIFFSCLAFVCNPLTNYVFTIFVEVVVI